MSYRPHGKHVHVDSQSPKALGICDYTGFVFLRSDLLKQMEWRGNSLEWTGFYVGRPYLDVPNPQLKPPILPPDPIPVKDPRPPQGTTETFSSNTLPVFSEITTPFNQIGNISDGAMGPSEGEKLTLLEQNNFPQLISNGGPPAPNQSLTQAQILQQLQTTSWTTP